MGTNPLSTVWLHRLFGLQGLSNATRVPGGIWAGRRGTAGREMRLVRLGLQQSTAATGGVSVTLLNRPTHLSANERAPEQKKSVL